MGPTKEEKLCEFTFHMKIYCTYNVRQHLSEEVSRRSVSMVAFTHMPHRLTETLNTTEGWR